MAENKSRIILSEALQTEMLKFFLKTSIPRSKKAKIANQKKPS